MKKFVVAAILLVGITSLQSCGGGEAETQEEKCTYSYNHENSVLEWTAFKYSNKTGVKGGFNTVNISGVSEADSPKELIESMGFNIPTTTVETNDPGRNAKIAEFFFGTIKTDNLSGRVLKLQDGGKAEVQISMNGITKTVPGTYTLDDVHFSFKATINVMDWDAISGIDALNAQCIENHTGEDGVLKLWSEVDLSFTTKLVKNCAAKN